MAKKSKIAKLKHQEALVKKYAEKDFCKAGDHRVGWYEYQVTKLAFEKLKEQYSISMESHLD